MLNLNRKIFKKALVWLKKQPKSYTLEYISEDGHTQHADTYDTKIVEYISQIEFALYKTKMNEFYIDYNFAEAIRPALLTKEIKNDTSRRPS